ALYDDYKNILVLGENEQRACDRLRSIMHELTYNERISQLFGNQVGPTWGATRLITSSGVCIQAIGKGQSLRGGKHLSHRPDLIIADDIEDEDAVRTPEARQLLLQWWVSTVMPAMAVEGHVRMLATPLRDGREEDEKSLP